MIFFKFLLWCYFKFVLRRPHLYRRSLFYMPDLRTLIATGINEIYYLLRKTSGYRVTCVVVELTTRCNLNCVICARHQVMTRVQGDMDEDTFAALVDSNPHVRLYILVGWGEMMLNKRFFEMVDYLGRKNKRIALTTNATLMTDENVRKLVNSAISHITMSVDGIDKVYESIRSCPFSKIESSIVRLYNAIKESKRNIYVEINAVGRPDVLAQAAEMRRRLGPYVNDIRFSSYLEYNKLLKTNRKTPCREFWRGMISVLYDGSVVPCCMDFNATMTAGRVDEAALQYIWNNSRMKKMRKEHTQLIFKNRCSTCHEVSPQASDPVDKRFG